MEKHFAESFVYLPTSYYPVDPEQVVVPLSPKVAVTAYGLPPPQRTTADTSVKDGNAAFVFCSFNRNLKIKPKIFDAWMGLLKKHSHTVLWLRRFHRNIQNNLVAHAVARGVDPSRLVFAGREADKGVHIARHKFCHLFLDTPTFNGHSTVVDALLAGLPVLTVSGNTLAGRVASSLVTGAGTPEMAVPSLDEYVSKASALVSSPEELADISARLKRAVVERKGLFDIPTLAANVEAAYFEMWRRYVNATCDTDESSPYLLETKAQKGVASF